MSLALLFSFSTCAYNRGVRSRWIRVGIGLLLICVILGAAAFWYEILPLPFLSPRVVRIEPPNDATGIVPTSPITITFSASMDGAQTLKGIRFEPPLRGDFDWHDDKTLVFTPRVRMPVSTTVSINISQDARSQFQRPVETETVSRFTTLSRPRVVESVPPLQARFVYIPDRVTMTFDRAMDASTLRDRIKLVPEPPHLSLEFEDRTLTLRGFFDPNTLYTITIPSSASDADNGIELGADLVWTFTATQQYPNFSILERDRDLNFPAGVPLRIPTQFTNISRFNVALYPLTLQEFETNAHAPFEAWYAFEPSAAPLLVKSVPTNAATDQYMQQELELQALARGTYYVRITTPEGISDSKLVRVE